MATISNLPALDRKEMGSAACRRLRRSGRVPASIYGHGQPPRMVSLDDEELRPILMSGAHVVSVNIDGQAETALLREVQWDTFGVFVKHVDLMRVDATQRIEVQIPLVLRGTAPGAIAGGLIEQPLHVLTIECSAIDIPDVIPVKIGHLEIGGVVHVRDLTDLPVGTVVKTNGDTIVVHVVVAKVIEEPTPGLGGTEPEVVGKKKTDEAEEKKDKK